MEKKNPWKRNIFNEVPLAEFYLSPCLLPIPIGSEIHFAPEFKTGEISKSHIFWLGSGFSAFDPESKICEI